MSYNIPENLKYTKEHEWISIENSHAYIGITDYAQDMLGDIVYIELPDHEGTISTGESFGVVESIKSVSDIYGPCDGKILEVNEELKDSPELCNQNAYKAWMIKIEIDQDKLSHYNFLTAEEYLKLCENAQ